MNTARELSLLLDEPIDHPAEPVFIRELTEGDLAILADPPPLANTQRPLVRIRYRHHQLARLLAGGTAAVEASAITGYSQVRISLLQRDPAFCELMAYYAGQAEAIFVDVTERLARVGTAALEEIEERLDDDTTRSKMTLGQLRDIVETTYDRSVAPAKGGPKGQSSGSAPVQVNIQFVEPQAREAIDITPGAKLNGQ